MQTDPKPCPRCGEPLASADDAEGCRDPLCPAPMIDYGDTERTAEDVAATFIAQVREAQKSDLLYRDLERDIVLADLIERRQAEIERLNSVIKWLAAPHTGHKFGSHPESCTRCQAEAIAETIREKDYEGLPLPA